MSDVPLYSTSKASYNRHYGLLCSASKGPLCRGSEGRERQELSQRNLFCGLAFAIWGLFFVILIYVFYGFLFYSIFIFYHFVFGVWGPGIGVWDLGSGFGDLCRVLSFVLCFGSGVWGVGFGVWVLYSFFAFGVWGLRLGV